MGAESEQEQIAALPGAVPRVIPVAPGIGMIRASSAVWPASANVYLFEGEEGIDLFDVGAAGDWAGGLGRLLCSVGSGKRTVRRVVLSHVHPDHAGSIGALCALLGPEDIIVHRDEREYAMDPARLAEPFDIALCRRRSRRWRGPREHPGHGDFDLLGYFQQSGCPAVRFEPTETVQGGDRIRLGRYEMEVIHTPGHAPGHIALWEKNHQMLFTGDLAGDVVAWYAPAAGGASAFLESLERIERLPARMILPSHGGLFRPGKRDVLNETVGKIRAREKRIFDALSGGGRTFEALLEACFPPGPFWFFPGVPILESHLELLLSEGRIWEEGEVFRRG